MFPHQLPLLFRADQFFTIERQCGGMNQAAAPEILCNSPAIRQRVARFGGRQRAHRDGDGALAKVGVGLQFASRAAADRRMARQIDRIGDQRCRDIGLGRGARQNRDRIGDAKRERPPAPA